VSDIEDGSISSYVPGQEFKPHFDSSPGAGINRRTTALVYLCNLTTDDTDTGASGAGGSGGSGGRAKAGGATYFTKLDLRVYPVEGALLFWDNHNASKVSDVQSEHAGESPLMGKKWIAQCFVNGL
jgi:hypothetical protein